MKLLYRGGYNKYNEESIKNSYFYEYADVVIDLIKSNNKVGFVTLAKPDGHYDERIIELYGDAVDIIDTNTDINDWSVYDLLFLCGGNTTKLKTGLEDKDFTTLDVLKKDVVVLGDSAGSMLLSPWYYETEDTVNLEFHKGLYPDPNTIVIVHDNNPRYCTPDMVKKISKFAQDNGLKVLSLSENETKLYKPETKVFVDFDFADLF